MTIDQLRYFYEVATAGSFTKAATKLYLSQPTLSEAITKFETELGEPLFRRMKTGVVLTAYGKELLPYAKNIIDLINQMPIQPSQDKDRQRFSMSTGHFRFMYQALDKLYERHKDEGIRLDHYNDGIEEAPETVANGNAEIGGYSIWNFNESQVKTRLKTMNLEFVPLCTSPATVTVGWKNPLFYREEDWITLDMIKDFPTPVAYSEAGKLLHKKLGIENKKNLVYLYGQAGGGSILTEYTDCVLTGASIFTGHKQSSSSQRRVLRLKDVPYFATIGYIKRKGIPLSPLAQEFVDILDEIMQEG